MWNRELQFNLIQFFILASFKQKINLLFLSLPLFFLSLFFSLSLFFCTLLLFGRNFFQNQKKKDRQAITAQNIQATKKGSNQCFDYIKKKKQ